MTMTVLLIAMGRFGLKYEKKRKSACLGKGQEGYGQMQKILSVFVWFVLFFSFVYYFCFLAELTLLTREAGSRIGISLRFLGTWSADIYSQCFMIENVLLFIPFGIFFVFLSGRLGKLWSVILASFLLSVTIEVTQLLTGRGYFQVDDIWLNTLGGMAGACFGMAVKHFLKQIGIDEKIDKWFFVC